MEYRFFGEPHKQRYKTVKEMPKEMLNRSRLFAEIRKMDILRNATNDARPKVQEVAKHMKGLLRFFREAAQKAKLSSPSVVVPAGQKVGKNEQATQALYECVKRVDGALAKAERAGLTRTATSEAPEAPKTSEGPTSIGHP